MSNRESGARREDQAKLRALARRLDLQTSYVDATGVRRYAAPEALLAVAGALTGEQAPDPASLLRRLDERQAPMVEPVTVAWLGRPASVRLNLPSKAPATFEWQLLGEGENAQGGRAEVASLTRDAAGGVALPLPPVDAGYHTLRLKAGRSRSSTLVIAAAPRAYRALRRAREWGAFLPLYALHSGRSWGAGDFADLRALSRWVRAAGGANLATLPLLAAFLEGPLFEPSPYAPVSRIAWNEMFVDVDSLPRPGQSDAFAALEGARAGLEAQRTSRFVDYERIAVLKRGVMEQAAAALSPAQTKVLRTFLDGEPSLRDYARFRARTERHGPWQSWPNTEPDFDSVVERYHAYAQWCAEAQLADAAGDPSGAGLYMDLPLGVHASGYDTWRWPQCFVPDASVGAPPDPLATQGQDWGFPPLHPRGIREGRHEYVIAFLRHHMKHATRLRIDHVMGLHRLFVIPRGFEARDGVYVRYPAEELYAILSLESHRHQTEIVGENLGTVPGEVGRAIRRHNVSGMYVLPFEVDAGRQEIRMPHESAVAALNTHDLPTFAGWWSGEDIALRESLRLAGPEQAAREREERAQARRAVLSALDRRGLLPAGRREKPGACATPCCAFSVRARRAWCS